MQLFASLLVRQLEMTSPLLSDLPWILQTIGQSHLQGPESHRCESQRTIQPDFKSSGSRTITAYALQLGFEAAESILIWIHPLRQNPNWQWLGFSLNAVNSNCSRSLSFIVEWVLSLEVEYEIDSDLRRKSLINFATASWQLGGEFISFWIIFLKIISKLRFQRKKACTFI